MKFWINDDWDASGQDVDGENAPRANDYSDSVIGSVRDLEDFARLWIVGLPALPSANGYSVTLSWQTTSGNPAIRLYRAYETNGGTGYLTDTNTAAAQALHSWDPLNPNGYGDALGASTISPTSPFTFPTNFFDTQGTNSHFLFEGAGVGSGQLVLTVSQGTNIMAQTGAWLDLHKIADFYEQAEATNVPSALPPSSLVSQYRIVHTGTGMGDETKQVIVYVHGINRPAWGAQNEGETMFKRLYWSGYHGHFAMFRWPCAYLPPNNWWPYTFNQSEFYAYKSAPAFKDYLAYLRNRTDLAGYAIDIIAHSQGSALVSESLSQGATFDNCILSQGAVPAQCYDGSAPTLPVLTTAEESKPTPFSASTGGYDQCWTNISGNVVNFFNTNDFALASGSYGPFDANWVKNQQSQKPESFGTSLSYVYYPSNQTSVAYPAGASYTVTDWEEGRSMVARSRTSAIGAQGLATGQTRQGVIAGSLDLNAQFGFDKTRPEHSAQLTRPIQSVWGYYDQILLSFGMQPVRR
jgi:predicted esterase